MSVTLAPLASVPILQPGKPVQPPPPPTTPVMVILVGLSVTVTLLAVSGPLLVTTMS